MMAIRLKVRGSFFLADEQAWEPRRQQVVQWKAKRILCPKVMQALLSAEEDH